MEKMLLKEPEIFPSKEVLKNVLNSVYSVFEEFETRLTNECALTFNWHYYKDSKGWLCKVCHKTKTVFWLSVWDGYFKISFYFLERHLEGIAALEIDDRSFELLKQWGKMTPLIFNIKDKEQFPDVLKMVWFKMRAK